MYMFGAGRCWAIKNDALKTPVEFALLQNISVDFSFDKKELYGSKQFPVKVVRSKGKIDCKAAFAQIRPSALDVILTGTTTTGQKLLAAQSTTIPDAPGPYTVQVTNFANFTKDLGVLDVSGNVAVPMTKVVAGGGATAGTSTSAAAPSTDISQGTDTDFKIAVDGGAPVTISLDVASCSTGAAIAAEMQQEIRAEGGALADVLVRFTGGVYVITSGTLGASSAIVITNGDNNNVADNLKIGVANGGVEAAGAGAALTTGQYSVNVNTGTYTFSPDDKNKDVEIDYLWTDASTGKTITLANNDMGTATIFSACLNGNLDDIQVTLWLEACISNKLGMALKQEDFLIPDFDFSAFAGADGSPGWLSLGATY